MVSLESPSNNSCSFVSLTSLSKYLAFSFSSVVAEVVISLLWLIPPCFSSLNRLNDYLKTYTQTSDLLFFSF